eukprot:93244-Amphidinium_carterae.1
MMQHSPTVKKAKERCRNMDQVREANRIRREADLRKEQEAREKSSKEMKKNEDELREVIRQDAKVREDAHKSAILFMNDNADNSILHKHCEAKITRAIGEKNAALYARYVYILGIATGQNLERLFDAVDQETNQSTAHESQEQGGLTGKTTSEAQQAVEVYGNGSQNQYMGKIPSAEMPPWVRRFAERQRRVKEDNAILS